MKKRTRTLWFLYFSIIFLLAGTGCSIPKTSREQRPFAVPGTFDGGIDSASSADLSKEVFYRSPYLTTLLDTVLKNNFDLAIASRRIEMANAQLLQSRAALAPSVQFSGMAGMRKFGLYTMDGAGNASTDIESGKVVPTNLPDFFYGLQSSWEVDLWGKLKNRKKAALSRFMASMEARQLIQTTLIAETAAAYYELQSDDQILRLLEQTIRIQEQAVEVVRVQKDAGKVNQLAVQQFEAQLLGMRAMQVEFKQKIVEHESRINLLAGRFAQPIPRDSSFFITDAVPLLKTGLPSAMMRNRPDIRQAEWEIQASMADLKAARAAFYPSLTLNAAAGLQSYRNSLILLMPESIAYNVLAGLSAPLINRRMLLGDFSKANAQQHEAILLYRKQVSRAFLEVFQELNNIRNLEQIYEIKNRETELLSSAIAVSADLFRTGRADYLEVLIATQQALRANMERISTRKNQYLAAISLYKYLGGGWKN
jgi:NodT family efflux transporter outer membrane factor (OMF) lipoprotein